MSLLWKTHVSATAALPNKLFEFIQARIAVIVSPTVDQARLVTDAGVGLVCNGFDVTDIRLACEKFLTGMSGDIEANLEKAARIYSWQNQEKSLLKNMSASGN